MLHNLLELECLLDEQHGVAIFNDIRIWADCAGINQSICSCRLSNNAGLSPDVSLCHLFGWIIKFFVLVIELGLVGEGMKAWLCYLEVGLDKGEEDDRDECRVVDEGCNVDEAEA